MAQEKFIEGKADDCAHEGRRSTRRREYASQAQLDAYIQQREDGHAPVRKYFSLFHGERQRLSEMKPCQSAIDPLIRDGTLVGQLTLDEDMVVFKAGGEDLTKG
jgi:hypothetical protein